CPPAVIAAGGPVLVGRRAIFQGRQCLGLLQLDAGRFRHAAAVVLVAMPEVPDHAQGDGLWALPEVVSQIADQVLPLPVLEAAVALAGLLVVRAGLLGL